MSIHKTYLMSIISLFISAPFTCFTIILWEFSLRSVGLVLIFFVSVKKFNIKYFQLQIKGSFFLIFFAVIKLLYFNVQLNFRVLLLGHAEYVSYLFLRIEGDYFIYDIRFHGVNFPANGPVMQKKTLKWEPSTEKMYVRDGVLIGEVNMALLLEGNTHHRCNFKSTYK